MHLPVYFSSFAALFRGFVHLGSRGNSGSIHMYSPGVCCRNRAQCCLCVCVGIHSEMCFCAFGCRPGLDRQSLTMKHHKKKKFNWIQRFYLGGIWISNAHIGLTQVPLESCFGLTLTLPSLLSPLLREKKLWQWQKLRHAGSAQAHRAIER